jgi:molybdenum cofactor cytidylyltransferase
MSEKIGIVILAAGDGTRFGGAKQLAEFNGKALLHKSLDVALSLRVPIFLVLGSRSELILDSLKKNSYLVSSAITIIYNHEWEVGLSTSINKAIHEVVNQNGFKSIIFMTCDQPLITTHHIQAIINMAQTSKENIVASAYQNVLGIPALFKANYFQSLLSLNGDKGAGIVIKQNLQDCAVIPFEDGSIDIDTKEDLERFI